MNRSNSFEQLIHLNCTSPLKSGTSLLPNLDLLVIVRLSEKAHQFTDRKNMATQSANPIASPSRPLSVDVALQIAWWTWFLLLTAPFVVFLAVVWQLMDSEAATTINRNVEQGWFVGSMAYMGLGVPAAFFWRSRIFKGYWAGKVIPPRDYLIGMGTIWLALELGGLLALVGCLVSNTLLPNLLPALLAFMLFTPLWPNGHSMTRPLENERDPAHYEDPR